MDRDVWRRLIEKRRSLLGSSAIDDDDDDDEKCIILLVCYWLVTNSTCCNQCQARRAFIVFCWFAQKPCISTITSRNCMLWRVTL